MNPDDYSTSKSVNIDDKGKAAFQIVSSAGCPILVINEVWNQLDIYIEFLKPIIVITGAYLTLFGRIMGSAVLSGTGYLSTLAFSIFLYSFNTVDANIYDS